MRTTPPTFRKKVLLWVRAREQRELSDPVEVWGTSWGVCPCIVSELAGKQREIIVGLPRD
jgi:hypothetical protein